MDGPGRGAYRGRVPEADTISERLVDTIQAITGRHEGQRAAHARGVLCAGTFRPSAAAAEVCRAPHFAGGAHRAHARFSNGSGNPAARDAARGGHGLAVKLYLPDGATTDVVAITQRTFFVRTVEDFIAFGEARVPDPETGAPDMARIGAFLEAHPETLPAVQATMTTLPPESYARLAYHAIHAFSLTAPDGSERWVRWHWIPEAGAATLSDEQAAGLPRDYLAREIAERLESGSVAFSLEAEVAEEGDPTEDPTAAWPDGRERVAMGRLELTGVAHDRERDGDVLVFDPVRVCDGIGLSADPILRARSGAYRVSVARRTGQTASRGASG